MALILIFDKSGVIGLFVKDLGPSEMKIRFFSVLLPRRSRIITKTQLNTSDVNWS